MKLISSREAVNFLSQVAPRPWVQRMLRWMVFDEGLHAYTRRGKVQAYCYISDFTISLYSEVGEFSGPKMDAAIRAEYPDIADQILGRRSSDRFDGLPVTWDETIEPKLIEPGFFLYATEIDWDAGILTVDDIPAYGEMSELFFENSELLESELDRPQFEVRLEGLSFEFSKIEMLLPSMELGQTAGFMAAPPERRKPVGRPQKWDWEGAIAHVVAHAQHPDGLPTGPGAQARIEALISDWFMLVSQDAPSSSQVRQRAAKIMHVIETPKTD